MPDRALPTPSPASDELLPCPFCGAEQDGVDDYNEGAAYTPAYLVRCSTCGVQTETFREIEHAVKAWNTRAASARRPPAGEPDAHMVISEKGWRSVTSSRHSAEGLADSHRRQGAKVVTIVPLYRHPAAGATAGEANNG